MIIRFVISFDITPGVILQYPALQCAQVSCCITGSWQNCCVITRQDRMLNDHQTASVTVAIGTLLLLLLLLQESRSYVIDVVGQNKKKNVFRVRSFSHMQRHASSEKRYVGNATDAWLETYL